MEAGLTDLLTPLLERPTWPLRYAWHWVAVWTCALAGAILYAVVQWARGRPGGATGLATRSADGRTSPVLADPVPPRARRIGGVLLAAAGVFLMTVPLWSAFWSFLGTLQFVAQPGTFVPARTRLQLSNAYMRTLLLDVGYLGSGFLLWTMRDGLPRTVRDLAARVRRAGVPLGRSEGRSTLAGWLVFPALLAATVALDWVVRNQVPVLVSGDVSQVWRNMTPYHAVMLSAAAAVGEELVYRGLLLVGLLAGLRRVGLAGPGGAALAVFLQAALFGAAHGGYGSWFNLLAPFLFGLIAGAVAMRWGLHAAIVLHFLVDLYVFGFYAGASFPWFSTFLVILLAANTLCAVTYGAWWLRRRRSRRAKRGRGGSGEWGNGGPSRAAGTRGPPPDG